MCGVTSCISTVCHQCACDECGLPGMDDASGLGKAIDEIMQQVDPGLNSTEFMIR